MCGRNATHALFPVETLKLEAGSTIGFAAAGMKHSYNEHDDFSDVSSCPVPKWCESLLC